METTEIQIDGQTLRLFRPSAALCMVLMSPLSPGSNIVWGMACLGAAWGTGILHPLADDKAADPYDVTKYGRAMLEASLSAGLPMADLRKAASEAFGFVAGDMFDDHREAETVAGKSEPGTSGGS